MEKREGNFIFTGMLVGFQTGTSKKSGKPYFVYNFLIGDSVYKMFSQTNMSLELKKDYRCTFDISSDNGKNSYSLRSVI